MLRTPESIDNATLIETPESRQRREKAARVPLTEAEQTNLMEAAQRKWEEAGFLQREGGEEKLIGEVVKVEAAERLSGQGGSLGASLRWLDGEDMTRHRTYI